MFVNWKMCDLEMKFLMVVLFMSQTMVVECGGANRVTQQSNYNAHCRGNHRCAFAEVSEYLGWWMSCQLSRILSWTCRTLLFELQSLKHV